MTTGHIVWCPEYGHEGPQDGKAFPDTFYDWEAAEKWAELQDEQGDYTIVGGSAVTVAVQASDGTVTRCAVYGESVPSYHASRVSDT
jgi:hypothetical protein